MREKHSATEKLAGLPVSETWPKHVVHMLRPCKDCENEMPCEFFRGVVEQGGEEDKSGLDDSSCDTSGIGSDDSGHSGAAGGKTKPENKPQVKKPKEKAKKPKEKMPQKKEQENNLKEATASTSKKKTPQA